MAADQVLKRFSRQIRKEDAPRRRRCFRRPAAWISLGRISEIDGRACRNRVQQYFSIDTMVEGYERVYSMIFDLEAKR